MAVEEKEKNPKTHVRRWYVKTKKEEPQEYKDLSRPFHSLTAPEGPNRRPTPNTNNRPGLHKNQFGLLSLAALRCTTGDQPYTAASDSILTAVYRTAGFERGTTIGSLVLITVQVSP